MSGKREAHAAAVISQRARADEVEATRDRVVRRASRAARHEVAEAYKSILSSLEEKWSNKERETDARIRLHEVVANIDLLKEIKDEGLSVDEELARLTDLEQDCTAVVDLCPSSAWSLADLDLPEVSADSSASGDPLDADEELNSN